MFRRTLLSTLPAFALGACTNTTVAQGAQYVVAAGNAVRDFVAFLPASAMTTAIQGYANQISTAASAVAANPSAVGSGMAQQAYDAIKALLPLAAPLVATVPGASIALAALSALLPFIATAAGLVAAPLTASEAMTKLPKMTVEEAMVRYGQK